MTSQHSRTIALTGAGGGIGRRLLSSLATEFRIKALFRRESDASRAAATLGAEPIFGDLNDEGTLERLMQGASIAIHCAVYGGQSPEPAHRTNVEGTRRAGEAALRAQCLRFVHLSSVAAYLGNEGRNGVYTEDLPLTVNRVMDVYSRTKLEGETALRELAASKPLELVVLRPTCVYGPGVESWTNSPMRQLVSGAACVWGDGKGEINVVHVDDVIQAIRLAATHPDAPGNTFNVGDRSIGTREFLSYYSRIVGKPVKSLPRWLVDSVMLFGETAEALLGSKLAGNLNPKGMRLFDFCTNGVPGREKFPSTKLRTTLGYAPAVSLSAATLEIQRWAEDEQLIKERRTFRHLENYYTFQPAHTFYPECEADLQEAVKEAVRRGKRVRAVGTLHSPAPTPATDAAAISLERINRPIRIDGHLATVQPGMLLGELNAHLAANGLALPTLGAIALQSIAGAVSTGTHGGSFHQGSLADVVDSVRMVTAAGDVLALDRSDERFFGVVLSLGMCGIFSELTLRCVPTYWLRTQTQSMSLDEFLERLAAPSDQDAFFEGTWYPIAERAEVRTCTRLPGPVPNREIKKAAPTKVSPWAKPFVARAILMMESGRLRGLHRRVVNGAVGTWYPTREGRSDYVLPYQAYHPGGLPVTDVEVGVPVEHVAAAIRALREEFIRRDRYLVAGVRVRPQKSEPYWLSASGGRDICWLEFYPHQPSGDFVSRLHEVLRPFAYRPHWGKVLQPDPKYWAEVYPHYERFLQLRNTLDPNGVFTNEYVRSIGLAPQS